MELIDRIIQDLENALEKRRLELGDGTALRDKIEIKVLGQMSLLMNREVSLKLYLASTADFDAKIQGNWGEAKVFRDILKANGLKFDELSGEIWIPEDAQFIEYYDSQYVKISYLDPISALTSKAIKAKEKNRLLVGGALKLFGEMLAARIIANGGDPAYFTTTKKTQL